MGQCSFKASPTQADAMTQTLQASSAEAVPVDKLPPLPYAADALEPYIDTMTMEIHHDRHHQTYVTKLQTALDQASDLKGKSLVSGHTVCSTS